MVLGGRDRIPGVVKEEGEEAAVEFGGAEEEGYVVEIDYLLLIKKPHLPRGHARILVQIRPGRVDDRDVVFLIACAEPINQSINQSIKYPTTSPSPLFHVSWDVGRAGLYGLANLQLNSPWSTARTPPPAPWATRPMSARARGAGRCARRRGCRRGTVMPFSQHGRFSLPPPKGLCPFFLLDGQTRRGGGGGGVGGNVPYVQPGKHG